MEPTGMVDAPAPTVAPEVPTEQTSNGNTPTRGDRKSLFGKKKPRTKWVTLSDGQEYLVRAVSPRRMAEINAACLVEVTAPTEFDPAATKREWDATMRVFYIVASGLCDPDGDPMFKNPAGEPQTAWRAGAHRVADELGNDDVEVLYVAIEEVSGLGKAGRQVRGKESERTPLIAPS